MPGVNIRATNGTKGRACHCTSSLARHSRVLLAGIQRLCSRSSFRRKPESSVFAFSLGVRATAFARPSAERVTFSARAEKVTKETRPSAWRPTRILRCGSASAAGMSAIHRAQAKLFNFGRLCCCFCAHDARCFVGPFAWRRPGPRCPIGVGAMDRADSAACARMHNPRNTGRGRGLFGQEPEKRHARGAFLLVTFLCASKEK